MAPRRLTLLLLFMPLHAACLMSGHAGLRLRHAPSGTVVGELAVGMDLGQQAAADTGVTFGLEFALGLGRDYLGLGAGGAVQLERFPSDGGTPYRLGPRMQIAKIYGRGASQTVGRGEVVAAPAWVLNESQTFTTNDDGKRLRNLSQHRLAAELALGYEVHLEPAGEGDDGITAAAGLSYVWFNGTALSN